MKNFTIEHPQLNGKNLKLIVNNLGGQARLYLDGTEILGRRGTFDLSEELNVPCVVKLKQQLHDIVPKVIVNGDSVEIEKPLKWYEYVWSGLGIGLLAGGALGGVLAFLIFRVNNLIFRSAKSITARYVVTLLLTALGYLLFLFIGGVVHALIGN